MIIIKFIHCCCFLFNATTRFQKKGRRNNSGNVVEQKHDDQNEESVSGKAKVDAAAPPSSKPIDEDKENSKMVQQNTRILRGLEVEARLKEHQKKRALQLKA
jgi:hypothetical protein